MLKDDFPDVKETGPDEFYAAFTVAELGERLPAGVGSRVGSSSVVDPSDKNWVTTWSRIPEWDIDSAKFAKTEADARAKLLIYLLENNLIPLTEKSSSRGSSAPGKQ
jgi:hypothetical protein